MENMKPLSKASKIGSSAPQPDLEDDEDDYMKMTFTETPAAPETSFQRRKRLMREAEIKGRTKSKAELAAEATATREAALASSLLSSSAADTQKPKNKGLAMMSKMGFKSGSALGAEGAQYGEKGPAKEPIQIELKSDRGGIGADAEQKRKAAEAWDAEVEAVKRRRQDEGDFVTRVRREREVERLEKLVGAAQRVAEGMEEEREKRIREEAEDMEDAEASGLTKKKGGKKRRPPPCPTLKSVNVLWRGLVRAREEAEREKRVRVKMLDSLSTRLPTYATDEDEEDDDDRRAMGKSEDHFRTIEADLDEEDPELQEFEALEVEEKLSKLVAFLREKHNYCFWCKFRYPDETMDGCPGVTEEDHD